MTIRQNINGWMFWNVNKSIYGWLVVEINFRGKSFFNPSFHSVTLTRFAKRKISEERSENGMRWTKKICARNCNYETFWKITENNDQLGPENKSTRKPRYKYRTYIFLQTTTTTPTETNRYNAAIFTTTNIIKKKYRRKFSPFSIQPP